MRFPFDIVLEIEPTDFLSHAGLAGVYVIFNAITGARYVGRSETIGRRLKTHYRSLQPGWHGHHNQKMTLDRDRHGLGSFRFAVLELCDARVSARAELRWIHELRANYNEMNYYPMPLDAK